MWAVVSGRPWRFWWAANASRLFVECGAAAAEAEATLRWLSHLSHGTPELPDEQHGASKSVGAGDDLERPSPTHRHAFRA